jgi:hypothetical protein
MSARTETAHLRDRLKKELEHEDVVSVLVDAS